MHKTTGFMVNANLSETDLSGIKGILWDLDNTLYAYEPVHALSFEACKKYAAGEYGLNSEEFTSAWNTARKSIHEELHGQASSHSRLLYAQRCSEILFGKTDAQFSLDMESVYWNTFLENMKWNPGIETFLDKAKAMGIRMCLVTDLTCAIQLKKWIRLNLGRYMDFMISSEEAGIEKPNARMFELALEKLKLNADEVLMIGDSEEKDIRGAAALGIKTIHVK